MNINIINKSLLVGIIPSAIYGIIYLLAGLGHLFQEIFMMYAWFFMFYWFVALVPFYKIQDSIISTPSGGMISYPIGFGWLLLVVMHSMYAFLLFKIFSNKQKRNE